MSLTKLNSRSFQPVSETLWVDHDSHWGLRNITFEVILVVSTSSFLSQFQPSQHSTYHYEQILCCQINEFLEHYSS